MIPRRQSIHGSGKAAVRAFGTEAVFSELSYSYPLKLVSPTIASHAAVAITYVLSYGGGLISGDRIDMRVEVNERAMLVMLTQVRSGTRNWLENPKDDGVDFFVSFLGVHQSLPSSTSYW